MELRCKDKKNKEGESPNYEHLEYYDESNILL
jgi:hypothetical protein